MSFRTQHEWRAGATLPRLDALGALAIGATLAVCTYCETLRVVEPDRVTFIQRKAKEVERVRSSEPPCVAPAPFFRAPEDAPAPLDRRPVPPPAPIEPAPLEPPPTPAQGSLW